MVCNHIPSVRCPECADNRPSMGYWPTPCGTCAALREENARLKERVEELEDEIEMDGGSWRVRAEAAEAKLAVREHPAAICVHDGLADPQRLSVCLMCEEAITRDLRVKLAKVVETLEVARAKASGWTPSCVAALAAAKGEK